MENEIVKYNNDFNNQALRSFTAEELNLLITLFHKLKEKGTNIFEYSFYELKKLIRLEKNMTTKEFVNTIMNVNKKLLSLNYTYRENNTIVQMTIFKTFKIKIDKQILMISLNEDFRFLLNDFNKEWTRFELKEFITLKSSYTKEFYRRMKQFKNTGFWRCSLDEFRYLMDIPESYKVVNIDTRVLKPIMKELGEKYNLKIEKKYGFSGGRGRSRVVGFEFRFNTEKKIKEKKEKRDLLLREIDDKEIKRSNLESVVKNLEDRREHLDLDIEKITKEQEAVKYKIVSSHEEEAKQEIEKLNKKIAELKETKSSKEELLKKEADLNIKEKILDEKEEEIDKREESINELREEIREEEKIKIRINYNNKEEEIIKDSNNQLSKLSNLVKKLANLSGLKEGIKNYKENIKIIYESFGEVLLYLLEDINLSKIKNKKMELERILRNCNNYSDNLIDSYLNFDEKLNHIKDNKKLKDLICHLIIAEEEKGEKKFQNYLRKDPNFLEFLKNLIDKRNVFSHSEEDSIINTDEEKFEYNFELEAKKKLYEFIEKIFDFKFEESTINFITIDEVTDK